MLITAEMIITFIESVGWPTARTTLFKPMIRKNITEPEVITTTYSLVRSMI